MKSGRGGKSGKGEGGKRGRDEGEGEDRRGQKMADLTGSRAYERFTGNQILKIHQTQHQQYKDTEVRHTHCTGYSQTCCLQHIE